MRYTSCHLACGLHNCNHVAADVLFYWHRSMRYAAYIKSGMPCGWTAAVCLRAAYAYTLSANNGILNAELFAMTSW